MKTYPTIARKIVDTDIYAFDKIDGSNIRAEWARKHSSFVKFGSRKRLLGEDQGKIAFAEELINDNFLKKLNKIFRDQRYDRVVAFFEVYGPNSFAGTHPDPVSDFRATLIDVAPYKKGIIPPKEFVRWFSEVDIPPVLHHGKPNADFVESVRKGTLEGMTFEGVVCKAQHKIGRPFTMFKIKSEAWLTKLREYCGNNDKMFEMLQ
jgi:hypothetical protein